jgi:HEXXH motif-containing protein
VPSRHSLTDVEFGALAVGDPDAIVIGKLLDGQFSKRIVMLSAIFELAAERCPDAYPALDAACRLMAEGQAEDRAAVRMILTHPTAGTWAIRCLRRLQGAIESPVPLDADLRYLAVIAAAAAIRAGHNFTIEVPVREGAVMLPTLGLATLGPDADGSAATVSSRPGRT